MSLDDVDRGLAWGAVALVGIVATAVSLGREGGGEGGLFDVVPHWRSTWLNYRPEFYADIVAQVAHPAVPAKQRRGMEVYRSTEYLYGALMQAQDRIGRYNVLLEGFVADRSWWQLKFDQVVDAVRRGDTSMLSSDERAALKAFLVAVSAYKRVSLAITPRSLTSLGTKYVRAHDLALALALRDEDVVATVRAKLEEDRDADRRELLQGQYPKQVISDERVRMLERKVEEGTSALRRLASRGEFLAKYAEVVGVRR